MDEALAIYAQPKVRGRGAAKPPLADLGVDPVSGRPVVVKDGRFGAYVTDGETNATLGRGDDFKEMTLERGLELLAYKRAKTDAEGDSPKPAKKAAAKKTAKKATKKATKKKAAKKAAPKKDGMPKSSPVIDVHEAPIPAHD